MVSKWYMVTRGVTGWLPSRNGGSERLAGPARPYRATN